MPTAADTSTHDASKTKASRTGGPEIAGGRRLIEEWLPIEAIGLESLRERTAMTPFPAPNRLHVWWARRPLVASRAAVLASLLPADADQKKFVHMLGIHGDPVAAKSAMDQAKIDGERIKNPYGYKRAFTYVPSKAELKYIREQTVGTEFEAPVMLDCTAGGGAIPFEAARLGCVVSANDLNPVAWLLLTATIDFPMRFGTDLVDRYEELSAKWLKEIKKRMSGYFPPSPREGASDTTLLWARTIRCPYTGGVIPLSPNWKLHGAGNGIRYVPVNSDDAEYNSDVAVRLGAAENAPYMRFEMVERTSQHSPGTVKGGKATCPFPGDAFGRVIDGDYIKAEGRAGRMGDQLFAVVYTEKREVGTLANGNKKYKKFREFRAPVLTDDVSEKVGAALAEKLPSWEASGVIPNEERYIGPADRSALYGVRMAKDMFTARQLVGHAESVEVFHQLINDLGGLEGITDLDRASLTYIAIAIDKMLDWNCRGSTWEWSKQRIGHTFARHDFAFRWSSAEMAVCEPGVGYDWIVKATAKAIKELCDLSGHGGAPLLDDPDRASVTVTCKSGEDLDHISNHSVDTVVFDPPYYDNVMYAELSDFFYVWLKRTAGLLFPEPFSAYLTDKDREAVANSARFKQAVKVKGAESANKRAGRDYQEKMAAIFAECRRVLKPEGVMTLMFTHKASGAWDALATGLVQAGFVITASWPVQTESEGSLHIRDKNAAKSTIFLVCRPLPESTDGGEREPSFWEEVEPKVRDVVRERVQSFQEAGIGGVDLYLACFGPALQVFSENWPMTRGRPKQKPEPAKGAQLKLAEDDNFDPYAVVPEDALMAARSAVKAWRFDQLAQLERKAQSLDPVTEWFILAWDAFKAASFPADEALKLARVVGVSFDKDLRNQVLEVKGGNIILWDSETRAKNGTLGSVGGDRVLDALHGAAWAARERNLEAAQRMIKSAEIANTPEWQTALKCLLEVLPVPGPAIKPGGVLAGAAADAGVLDQLRQLLHGGDLPVAQSWTQNQGKLFATEPEA